MKRYTASQLPAHLSEALDEVERGGEVSVDRGKQTFRIVAGRATATAKTRRKKLDFQLIDERLLDGWTWQWQGPGRPMKLRVGGSRDRFIVAHALLRGWRLATSDSTMLEQMPCSATFEL